MYFDNHAHTEYSNLRLLDAINKPIALIDKAIEYGLSGIAITDHESLSSHIKVNKYAKKLQETNPDFKVVLGNEIYLTETRDMGQRYWHFILLAKDSKGYRAIKELSSIAWMNGYYDRRLERVPTLKQELKEVMSQYKGHVVGTSACIGGELGSTVLELAAAELAGATDYVKICKDRIIEFMKFCIDVFGKDDFYIEVAPAANEEQIIANKRLLSIAYTFGVQMCVGNDAHYLVKEDRYVHKAYLNSKGGEREVDSFYEFCYLKTEEEARELLRKSFTDTQIDKIFESSNQLAQKFQFYSLESHQSVPEVDVTNYPPSCWWSVNNDDADEMKNYPELKKLFTSSNIQERYWINECWKALKEKVGPWRDHLDYVARLNEEARVKRIIGEKLNTCMFAYPNTLKHYVDLFWECGSTVGAGRGSACAALNHYLLGITQLDPIEWSLPFWRYINEERTELGDIDLDLAPSKIQAIFAAIRKERGQLGLVQVCTFGTEGTKSAVLTACRGYRSEEYPDGIDVDEAQYLSSLIPQERGFLWPIEDVVKGNLEKGRKPVQAFIVAVNQYPGLLDIITRIQGLVNKRSSHASGVILFDQDKIFDSAAVMRTPKGALITQWDLHDQEAAGSVKYDFLLTSVQDIIIKTIELLQNDNVIEKDLSLREVYNKYLHPSVLPQDDERMWEALASGEVLGCFQFDSTVGAQAAKKIRPRNPLEMADANGLMRLMTSEKGAESPLDKYVRFKNNISAWYQEMDAYHLTKEEQKVLEPYFLRSYGVPPSQEQMMMMLQDPNIAGFSLKEANDARKIVGKKQMNRIPELHEKLNSMAKSPALANYVWKCGIGPQMGYSFSIIHALAYSFIGMQTLYLATHFNPVYWNTAYLIVNSGSIDEDATEQTDYTKLAKAIGEIRNAGIHMSLVDINKSTFEFKADAEGNQILFGLKGLVNINNDLVKLIVENRPYSSLIDFMNKVNPNRTAMIALIKGGAFDQFYSTRYQAMVEYIWLTCDKKKRITLQNMPGLIRAGLLPQETEQQRSAKRIFEFNRYLKAECKIPTGYKLDARAIDFLQEFGYEELIDLEGIVNPKDWDKIYQTWMDIFREWIKSNAEEILDRLNTTIFMADWEKYAKGNLSSWEMEALCFYFHDHELKNVNNQKYGFVDYESLPEQPRVEKWFKRGNTQIPIYKLNLICGTCIAKNKTKSTVYLLTTTGVVPVKLRAEHFALFDKQVSKRNPDGTKSVVEKSWFNRGNMIVVQGIRRGDEFVAKKYQSSSIPHQLYHIDKVNKDGTLELRSERFAGEQEEEDYENR